MSLLSVYDQACKFGSPLEPKGTKIVCDILSSECVLCDDKMINLIASGSQKLSLANKNSETVRGRVFKVLSKLFELMKLKVNRLHNQELSRTNQCR